MNESMIITLAVLTLASILFISGKVRSDLVAVGALIALMLCDILTPAEALSGFSNSVVIMMVGLFVVGGGIFQTGLAKMVSSKMLQLAGTNETRLLVMIMIVTAAIGAFVSNTGTIAVMMPIVVSLAMSAGTNPGRLLMPLAFASSLGGMLTLIGTPPNLVVQETLQAAGYTAVSFSPLLRSVLSVSWLASFRCFSFADFCQRMNGMRTTIAKAARCWIWPGSISSGRTCIAFRLESDRRSAASDCMSSICPPSTV